MNLLGQSGDNIGSQAYAQPMPTPDLSWMLMFIIKFNCIALMSHI